MKYRFSEHRPILESASEAWNPYLIRDICLLESVQRRATKLIQTISGLNYEDRLLTYGLQKLETRRHRQDLIVVYKLNFFIKNLISTGTRYLIRLELTGPVATHSKLLRNSIHAMTLLSIFSPTVLLNPGMSCPQPQSLLPPLGLLSADSMVQGRSPGCDGLCCCFPLIYSS